MLFIKRIKIRKHERGFLFKDREFQRVLAPGVHTVFDPLLKVRVDVMPVRAAWIAHEQLDVIAKAGALNDEALVLDLKDGERAIVWIDGRANAVLGPGLHALWKVFRDVRAEVLRVDGARFVHPELLALLQVRGANEHLTGVAVEAGHVGLFLLDGKHVATLGPGLHAFWKGAGKVQVLPVNQREQVLDVGGQEIMTADKVTLRINAVVTFRVTDPLRALDEVEDPKQALYREAQLALRAAVGTRELDMLLAEKDAVAAELEGLVKAKAQAFGLEVRALGIRDVILPGEMKDLMNKVTEAKKAAEAVLITRREETAAMRSQANTAKLLENNPTLMRLRELEVLEKVAGKANLKVILGEQGLAERISKLL